MSSSSSPIVSPDKCFKYDVFLSFRGEDTRKNFTDHLYTALHRSGIYAFRDDEELQRGEAINDQLIKAIEDSRSAIVVISPNYASSSWCLDELAKILECKKVLGMVVLPIFHNVRPCVVRRQQEGFRAAFQKFEKRGVEPVKVQKWREALAEVANLSGWDSVNLHEARLVERIVLEIQTKLGRTFSGIPSKLVGIEESVRIVEEALDIRLDGTRSIGLVGMGGIGKTTLARVVYERMLHLFNARCFIANIREVTQKEGIVSLQKQLIQAAVGKKIVTFYNAYDGVCFIRSRMQHLKVLLVLDDVDDIYQVEQLAGDLHWFGPGSRIIITTRDKHLLNKADGTYEVKLLDDNKALTLFRNHAFRGDESAVQHYESLSLTVCRYCDGLPLALETLGRFLASRSVKEWESAIKKLRLAPERKILDILRISYDGLDDMAKKVFLYIACILRGRIEFYVKKALSYLGLLPEINMRILQDKCLAYVYNKRIWAHDLLQELSRSILDKDSTIEPDKRQMLLSVRNRDHILDINTVTEATDGLAIDPHEGKEHPMRCSLHGISRLTKLRFLLVNGNIEYVGELKFLSNEMRFLYWKSCPLESLPGSFQPHDIQFVFLCSSSLRTLWDCNEFFGQLEHLDLRDSKNLLKIPDLSNLPNLKFLKLEGCTNLFEVRFSRALHENLTEIDLRGCTRLRRLPKAIEFPCLEIFGLSGCSCLERFPEISGRMEKLAYLSLDGAAMSELPPSVNQLVGLDTLSARNCHKLQNLPSTFADLESLVNLDLSGCSSLKKLPQNFGRLKNLGRLMLTGSGIVELPSSITQRKNFLSRGVCHLWIESSKRLKSLSEVPSSIEAIYARDCPLLEDISYLQTLSLPAQLYEEFHSSFFDFTNCERLTKNQDKNTDVAFILFKRFIRSIFTRPRSSKKQSRKVLVQWAYKYRFLIHGYQVPDWIGGRCCGSSLRIELPLLGPSDSWFGCVLCAGFVRRVDPLAMVDLEFTVNVRIESDELTPPTGFSTATLIKGVKSSLLWISFERFLFFWSHNTHIWRDRYVLGVRFSTVDPGWEVAECGVRLISMDEAETMSIDWLHDRKQGHDKSIVSDEDSMPEQPPPKKQKKTHF